VIATDQGLVLRTYPLRESSQIVGILGRRNGRLRVVAHGSRGGKHRFGGSIAPGNEIDFVYSMSPGRDLGTVREASLRHAWLGGVARLEVLATGLAVIELLDRIIPEGAQDAGLLDASLSALAAQRGSADRAGALLAFWRFELELLRHLGLEPQLGACLDCGREADGGGWLDVRAGALRCSRCRHHAAGAMRLPVVGAMTLAAHAAGGDAPAQTTVDERRAVGLAVHRLLVAHLERYRYPESLRLLKKVDTSVRLETVDDSISERPETA
jgi:DNA repair protein RecO